MNYIKARDRCHVRSGIYRTGDPTKVFTEADLEKIHSAIRELSRKKIGQMVPRVYWKNHSIPLDERIPDKDKQYNDWEEYDPREQPECSLYEEMPA